MGYIDKSALLMQTMDVDGINAEMAVEAEETEQDTEEASLEEKTIKKTLSSEETSKKDILDIEDLDL